MGNDAGGDDGSCGVTHLDARVGQGTACSTVHAEVIRLGGKGKSLKQGRSRAPALGWVDRTICARPRPWAEACSQQRDTREALQGRITREEVGVESPGGGIDEGV